MITADAIDFVNAGTITNMAYEVFEDMSRGVFVIEDTADGVDILRIEVDRDIVDFAHVPTVNGVPITGLGQDYITSSNIPPLPASLDTTTTYTIRVTNRTATALPAANRIEIDSFAILDADITDLSRGIPAGGTAYWSFTIDQTVLDNIVRNFRDRAALEIRIRFGTTFVTVLDNVGSQGSDTHYEFMDGTTDGTFRVTPSDTRIEQTVNVPVPSVDQTYSATSPNAQSGTAVAEAVAEGVQVGPRYITASNVPPLPQMLQASPDSEGNAVRYTMRVTNNTDADTPAFT